MKPITGHVTCKDGKWYAVINFPKVEGKRHEKWTPLDLEGPGKKKAAEARLNELLVRYNSSQSYMDQVLDKNELEQKRQRELRVDEYIGEWLEKHKSKRNIAVTTYSSYHTMLSSHIKPYFQNLGVSLGDVTENDIDDFYTKLFEAGLKGKTVQHYHAFLHLAFKNAVAKRIIASNPCDFVDRPKADEYIGEHLNATEVKKLIEGLKDDPMRVPTIITAYYGLRRSEVLGIK